MNSIDIIDKNVKDEIASKSEISASMDFPSIIDVSDEELEEIFREIKQIAEQINARAKE